METIKTLTYLVDKEVVEKLFRIGLIFKSDEQYFIFPQHYEKVKLTLSKLLEEEIHEMFEEMYFKEYKLYSFVSKEKDLFRSLKHIVIKRKTYHHRLKLVRYCNLTIKKLKDYQGNIIRYIIIPNNTDILVCTSDSLKYKVVSQDIPTERYIEDYINEYVDTEEKKIVFLLHYKVMFLLLKNLIN